jgi:hypothetical protein
LASCGSGASILGYPLSKAGCSDIDLLSVSFFDSWVKEAFRFLTAILASFFSGFSVRSESEDLALDLEVVMALGVFIVEFMAALRSLVNDPHAPGGFANSSV